MKPKKSKFGRDTSRASGYAWYAYPAAEDAPDCPFDFRKLNCSRQRDVAYWGSVRTATGLLNKLHDDGYLCLTYSECAPRVLDGWEVEPAELDLDFEASGCGKLRLIREIMPRDPDLEPFHQYEVEGWD